MKLKWYGTATIMLEQNGTQLLFEIRVLKGKHVVFDKWLVIKRIFSTRNLKYRKNLKYLLVENRICAEAGETVVYDITAAGRRILLLGSLNLDEKTEYPKECERIVEFCHCHIAQNIENRQAPPSLTCVL